MARNKKQKRVHRTPQQRDDSVVNKALAMIAERDAALDKTTRSDDLDTPPVTAPRVKKAKTTRTADGLLLTVADLCLLLNVSRSTVNRMERAGTLPGRIEIGGAVRYHRETVEAWLKSLVQRKP